MTNARINAQTVAASSNEVHAIGPFTGTDELDTLAIAYSGETAGLLQFTPVYHATPDADLASITAGQPIIETGDSTFYGQPGIQMRIAANVISTLVIPLRTAPHTPQIWIHVDINNSAIPKPLYVLMAVTTSNTHPILTPATIERATIPI